MTNEEAKKWLERFELAFPLPIEDYIEAKEALDMAIKALEQTELNPSYNSIKPELDCISREAVLDIINNPLNIRLDEIIKKLPPVTPKAEWIPCSDRLPEDYIHVLCQFTLGGMGECYLAHGVFHLVGGLIMTCNEVVAWQPLPEPYKAESEDEE